MYRRLGELAFGRVKLTLNIARMSPLEPQESDFELGSLPETHHFSIVVSQEPSEAFLLQILQGLSRFRAFVGGRQVQDQLRLAITQRQHLRLEYPATK